MANELAIRTVDDLGRVGKMMAVSGYFTDARDAAQASVKVLAGQEMGFGAFASMTGIYIIQGKPSVGANLMASAVKANPKYDYRIREISEEKCAIEFFELVNGKKESIGTSTFTIQEAKKAGVKNLDKYARNMLFARAMSNGIRWFCPDVFAGNVTYTPEELGAEVDEDGTPVKIEPAPLQQTPVIEAQDAVIEAEIVEPNNNTPVEEKPVEAPQKPEFDEVAHLKEWSHKTVVPGTEITLPSTNMKTAFETKTSKGKLFGKCETSELFMMWNAYVKRIMNPQNSQERKDDALMKLSAINEILTARKSAQEQLEKQGA